MSGIAGVLAHSDRCHAERRCLDLTELLAPFGPDDRTTFGNAQVALGRCLNRLLPEDSHDRQPWLGGDGSVYVADVRIDNRQDVAQALGLARQVAAEESDAMLLFRAWEHWGDDCVHRVEGDFAAARWTADARRLTLVRSALSLKPLYMAAAPSCFAFCTMPEPLARLPEVGAEPDLDMLARFLSQAPRALHATAYRGIERIHPGEIIRVEKGSVSRVQSWNPPAEPRHGRTVEQAAEEMRALLEQSVKARTRRWSGQVGSHLSGGRDSSAVAATAVRSLQGDTLLAFTGAPRTGYSERTFSGWLVDEASVAGRTAARHAAIQHHVCRHPPPFDLDQLRYVQAADQRPLGQPSQLPWWTAVNQCAASHGVSVMLTGSFGNLTISAGGEAWLPDLRRSAGNRAWWRQAHRFGGRSPLVWRSVLHGSFGPAVPASLYHLLRRIAGADTQVSLPILRQPYRKDAEEAFRTLLTAPPASASEQRRELLLERDTGEKVSLRLWGFDVRDPTADRRLAEFCLTLPPEQLMNGRHGRPVYDLAFGDRLDPEVLRPKLRGYQQADWHEQFRPEDVRRLFGIYAAAPAVGELIDLDFIEELIDRWPTSGWDQWSQVQLYRDHLLTALAVAEFLHRLSEPVEA